MKELEKKEHGDPGKNHRIVEITINAERHKTHAGENSVEHLKHLGQVPKDHFLAEVRGEKFIDLRNDSAVEIHGGERFVSHHHQHHGHLVEIKINDIVRKTHPGENSVLHLRKLGEVPDGEVLAEFKDGRFVDLADNSFVKICGGELFASHKPSGGSS